MTQRIALIPGDGIGPEVLQAARKVLEAASRRWHFSSTFIEKPWGCNYYLAHGSMLPEGALAELNEYDAILLGAIGDPRVPDHVSLWELLIAIRRGLRQYVNLRPIRLLSGIDS